MYSFSFEFNIKTCYSKLYLMDELTLFMNYADSLSVI